MSKRAPVIEVFPFVNGEWGFRLLGANGQTEYTSEGYTRRSSAKRAATRAKANTAAAQIVEQPIEKSSSGARSAAV